MVSTATPIALLAEDLWKVFASDDGPVVALADVSLEVREGSFVCVTGPSGSGKTTLLHLLGALTTPTRGHVTGFGCDYSQMNLRQRVVFRRRSVGFMLQELALVDHLTAIENIRLPFVFDSNQGEASRESILDLLERFGLSDRANHFPHQLSYGQRQRVALARALVRKPRLMLADEPTANLDWTTASSVARTLRELCHHGITVVIATHDERLVDLTDQAVRILGGRLCQEG